MTKRMYIDCFGNSVSEAEATDQRGMLRDGFGITTQMLFMDSKTTISDAAAWASTPAGAAAIAREEMVASMNRRPARTAADMFADGQAELARHAAAMPIMDAIGATSAVMAREARQAMIADMNNRSREGRA